MTSLCKLQILQTDDKTESIVNGVKYERLKDIPDPQMRADGQHLPPALPGLTAEEKEALVRAGAKGGTLDADGNIPMPSGDKIVLATINAQPKFIVNSVTYNSLDEIPDPELRQRVQGLMKARLQT